MNPNKYFAVQVFVKTLLQFRKHCTKELVSLQTSLQFIKGDTQQIEQCNKSIQTVTDFLLTTDFKSEFLSGKDVKTVILNTLQEDDLQFALQILFKRIFDNNMGDGSINNVINIYTQFHHQFFAVIEDNYLGNVHDLSILTKETDDLHISLRETLFNKFIINWSKLDY